jgi:predicted nucleotidyltransferase component of viral defense system
LDAFFELTQSFFLSGGGALAGFYLDHRETKDLDLFALPEVAIDEGVRALRSAAAAIGATAESVQEYPDFRRFKVSRGVELTLVDLVIDRAPQLVDQKPSFGAVRVDAIEEIAANKVCSLLGRAEIRDLVDLKELVDRGHSLEDLLDRARQKDAGVNPATIAWVLSQLHIGPRSALPTGFAADALEAFRSQLVERLTKMALPAE